MAKQAKPKAVKGRNDTRPNGKAWKKGITPPQDILDIAQAQHNKSKRSNAK